MEFDKKPYWEICKLCPINDKFRISYQDYNDIKYIAEIAFADGKWNYAEGIHPELLEEDTIARFKDSIQWYTSFLNDTEEHRKFILEFQIGCAKLDSSYIKVFYQDENGEWQHEEWSYDLYDGFIEIQRPNIEDGQIYSMKRFEHPTTPMSEIVDWVINDIKETCGTDKFMFYIDF